LQLTLLEAGARILGAFPEAVSAATAEQLRHIGVDIRTGVLLFGHSGPSPDDEAAVQWLRMAADASEPMAMTYLGHAYRAGRGGLAEYPQEAVRLWTKAAEHSNARAEEALGHAYEHGLGIPRNLVEARSWYRRAASHGSEGARRALEIPDMAEIASAEMGAAVLLGLLVLMAATAGDGGGPEPLSEVKTYSDTVGDHIFDLRDPIQLMSTAMTVTR
jgi:TPR repeat protein